MHEHHWVWRDFQDRVKYGGRFLNPRVQGQLEELFTDFPDDWTAHADGPVREYDAGAISIFRGRAARTEDDVRQILHRAAGELSPPPRYLRSAGRLNAQGIGVFYGGFSEDVCIAEMRPSLASYVVVGRFELVRAIKVLDLTAFDRHRPTGSLFRPGFSEELRRWRFLQSFHWSITQPVQPGTEAMEYVPTQVIGEYLHTVLGYDGLIYRSAQVGIIEPDDPGEDPAATPELRNLALFGSEGLVEAHRDASQGEAKQEDEALFMRALLDGTAFGVGRPQPVLHYVDESAVVYQIKKINYEWEREYIPLSLDDSSASRDDSTDDSF